MVFDLDKRLTGWKEAELIDSHQADRIREYEQAHIQTHALNDWSLTGFTLLGSVTIGIGIISLVAANWWKIPDFVKLTAAFLLLGTLAAGAFQVWGRKERAFETIIILLAISSLASIGLISQIYHTHGKIWELLLFWSAITSGLSYFSQHRFLPFFWVLALLVGGGLMASENPNIPFQPLFSHYPELVIFILFFVCAIAALLSFWLKADPLTWALSFWTCVSGVGALIAFELSSAVPPFASPIYGVGYGLVAILFILLSVSNAFNKTSKFLIATLLIAFLSYPFFITATDNHFVRAFLTLIILMVTAIFFAAVDRRGGFYAFIFLLGIRFLILYFQAFGGLALTGVGLLIGGLLIIGIAFLWQRYRHTLFTLSHRLSS